MTLRRGILLAGLAVWLVLAALWAGGVGGEALAYAWAALTLLLALEGVLMLTRRVRDRFQGRNGDA